VGSGTRWALADHPGSVRDLIDGAAGTVKHLGSSASWKCHSIDN
jgi:hypothetical protein